MYMTAIIYLLNDLILLRKARYVHKHGCLAKRTIAGIPKKTRDARKLRDKLREPNPEELEPE
jgi:hypothetical protein